MERTEPPGRSDGNESTASTSSRIGLVMTVSGELVHKERLSEKLDDSLRVADGDGKKSLATTPRMIMRAMDDARTQYVIITSPKPGEEQRVADILLEKTSRFAEAARGSVSSILNDAELDVAVRQGL